MTIKAFASGCAGLALTDDEKGFFADENPLGLILFRRNCESVDQVRGLTDSFRRAVDREDAPVLIDEEGGRVQRLRPPVWRSYPPARAIGDLYLEAAQEGRRAAWLAARLIAHELFELGITVNCLPVLDVPLPDVHDVIGDRGYAHDPGVVAVLGRAAADGLTAGGVLPVIKHMPGHGRVLVDSHHELPIVEAPVEDLEDHDFRPFSELNTLPIGMTAHIIYTAIDTERPGTLSPVVIEEIIRTAIGFDGLLLTDDISMNALSGTVDERAAAAIEAGVDAVVHCNGEFAEMRDVADACPALDGRSLSRFEAALAHRRSPEPIDIDAAVEEFTELVGLTQT